MLIPDSHGKGFVFRGCHEVEEKFGVKPSQIPDYLALVGDSSDNIPGVEGIGPKTAVQLIHQAGSVESMIQNPERIMNVKIRSKIQNAVQLLEKNLRLIRLITECGEKKTWTEHEFQRSRPDYKTIREIIQHFELKSVLTDIDRMEEHNHELLPVGDSDTNVQKD